MPKVIFSKEEEGFYIERARKMGYKVTKKAFKEWVRHAQYFVEYSEFFEDYVDDIGTKIR